MKSKLWKSRFALAGLAIAASLVLLSSQTLQASEHREYFFPKTIVGTWSVQVQLYNCQNEEPIGPAFSSLLTFDLGDTMTETTSNPGFAVGQRGPGHGFWHFTGRRSYIAKDTAFINFTTPAAPPASPGFTFGTQTITQEIIFASGPDEFTSDAKIQFADAAGNVYRQGCASATALRLK